MKTLLPNVNTSEGCFEIGVTISNPVFTEDAINKRKQERSTKDLVKAAVSGWLGTALEFMDFKSHAC